VDDTDPTITSGTTGTNLVENSGANQTVYTITADANEGGTISSYAIAGTDAALLSVNATSGVVTLTANPDYETKNSYSFTVTAADAAGTSAPKAVTFLITNVPEIGDFYQGGVVYYIFNSEDDGYISGEIHGLIAAVNQSSKITWSVNLTDGVDSNSVKIGNTSSAIGTGSANTDAIIALQGTASSHAAGVARAYNGGGYNDWFLPSLLELNEMYQNKSTVNTTTIANGGYNLSGFYWSSSESSLGYAFEQSFYSGIYASTDKDFTYNVRAVRAF
jgi:hypothetical protein